MSTQGRIFIVVLGVLAAILGGVVGRSVVRSLSHRTPDVTSQQALSKVASELNKTLPMMVDQETELTNVLGLEATIVYNYRLVNMRASELDASRLLNELKPRVSTAACTTPQTRDDFLKKGVTMRYVYYDASRAHIASFDVNAASCNF